MLATLRQSRHGACKLQHLANSCLGLNISVSCLRHLHVLPIAALLPPTAPTASFSPTEPLHPARKLYSTAATPTRLEFDPPNAAGVSGSSSSSSSSGGVSDGFSASSGPSEGTSAGVNAAMDAGSETVNREEVNKFGALADEWWDAAGPFAPLHAMNPVRSAFIRDTLCNCFGIDRRKPEPLSGLTILDVGCGGGLLAEALARMGATVTAVDAAVESVGVGRAHAARDPLVAARTTFRHVTAEELVAEGQVFDAVTSLEVIEHVEQPQSFIEALTALTKPWGGVCISTINRTPRSYAIAIVGAEQITRIVPAGTHNWDQFISPEELTVAAEKAGLELEQMAGMSMELPSQKWSLSDDVGVNYIAYFQKPGIARP